MPIGPGDVDGCQRVVLAALDSSNTPQATADGGPRWATNVGSLDSDTGGLIESADATGGVDITIDDLDPPGVSAPILTDLIISVDTAMTVTVVDTQTPTPYRYLKFFMAANSTIQITTRGDLGICAIGKKFQVVTSVAGNIAIRCLYKASGEFY